MATTRWEYKTLLIPIEGFLGPKVKTEAIDELLNTEGASGWEVVSALDVNRSHGVSTGLVVILKRQR